MFDGVVASFPCRSMVSVQKSSVFRVKRVRREHCTIYGGSRAVVPYSARIIWIFCLSSVWPEVLPFPSKESREGGRGGILSNAYLSYQASKGGCVESGSRRPGHGLDSSDVEVEDILRYYQPQVMRPHLPEGPHWRSEQMK